MSFKEQMDTYIELAKEKALLEQMCEFLDQFLPSDTRTEVKTIKTRHGTMTVEVDHAVIEKQRGQLVEKITNIVKEMESL